MKLACLQLSPTICEVEQNIAKADGLLQQCSPGDIDLLVLGEMTFTGYNFKDVDAIKPFLEPTTSGQTTQWAQRTATRLRCHVTAGYPEVTADGERYNSMVTVGPDGTVLFNYRKRFLYYTDISWAKAGESSFYHGPCGTLPVDKICAGICMDLNWEVNTFDSQAYEFARHCADSGAGLVVLSNAWISDCQLDDLDKQAEHPDDSSIGYWLERLVPLIKATLDGREVTIVIANRCGSDPAESETKDTKVSADGSMRVPFCGTSNVMKMSNGKVYLHGVLGQNEEKLLLVDTAKEPMRLLAQISVE